MEDSDEHLGQFMKQAFAREDVYRFKQLVKQVSDRVEAAEDDTPVISIQRKTHWATWAVAASVVVLLGFVFLFSSGGASNNDLIMATLEDPHLGAVRSGTENPSVADSLKMELSLLIHENDVDGFLVRSENYLATEIGDHANWVYLYRCYSLLKKGEPSKAGLELKNLIQPSELERAQKNFYLALINLHGNDTDIAIKRLQGIDVHPWDGYSKDLLEKIE